MMWRREGHDAGPVLKHTLIRTRKAHHLHHQNHRATTLGSHLQRRTHLPHQRCSSALAMRILPSAIQGETETTSQSRSPNQCRTLQPNRLFGTFPRFHKTRPLGHRRQCSSRESLTSASHLQGTRLHNWSHRVTTSFAPRSQRLCSHLLTELTSQISRTCYRPVNSVKGQARVTQPLETASKPQRQSHLKIRARNRKMNETHRCHCLPRTMCLRQHPTKIA